jgi:hypothetical protein
MPPLFRKPNIAGQSFEAWQAEQAAPKRGKPAAKPPVKPGLLAQFGQAVKKLLPPTAIQKATAIDQLSNLGKLIPAYNPRIFAEGGKISVELAGSKYTVDEAIKMFSFKGKPAKGQEAVVKSLKELQSLEGMLQKLPPPEGGRLASFEEAAQIAALRGTSDPTSAHYDPMRKAPKGKFNKKEIEEARGKEAKVLEDIEAGVRKRALVPGAQGPMTADQIQLEIEVEISRLMSARRVNKDIGGTPTQPSKIEDMLHPAATKLIKSGARAIESLGDRTNAPASVAKSISKVFTQADVLVKGEQISQEVADSIRNRMTEVLMRTPGGKEVLAAVAPGDVRAARGRATSASEGFYQDPTGRVLPKEKPVEETFGFSLGGRKSGEAREVAEDRLAERWRQVLLRQGPKGLSLPREPKENPLLKLIRTVQGRRMAPSEKPLTETPLPISRTRGGPSSADIRALKTLQPPEDPRANPELVEALASTSDPNLLLERLSRILKMPTTELAPHIDKFLDARAAKLRQIAEEVNRPGARRVGLVTSSRKGVSQVEQMSVEEAQALVEALGRGMKAVPIASQPLVDVPSKMRGARVVRGMERATTAPPEEAERNLMMQFVQRLQRGGVPMEKIAQILRYIG